ncbi:MAG: MATE family efflux transporter [Clostridiales bacterium]|nr:MATE family efflux transporter [Clostridiales bacterium]
MSKPLQNDLGRDPVGRLLFRLAVPAITAQLINALYNIVDRMYLGHLPGSGTLALTGVGVTFPIIMIISAFASLIGMGGAPLASIKMGEGDQARAERIMGNCFATLLGLSAVLTVFFLATKDTLLYWFGASDATFGYADQYLTIYVIGTLFVQLTLGMNAFINAQGFAKMGMLTVLIGAACNIILDPIFIFVFKMQVQGAALATILSQCLSACWVVRFLFSERSTLRIRRQHMRPSWGVMGKVLALGFAPFIMQSTESLVQITLNANLKLFGGDAAVGAATICSSVMQIVMMPLTGMTQGAQPIISYNYGAGNFDRVRKAFRYLLACCLAFSCLSCAAIELFPGLFISIFNRDPALREIAVSGMRIFFAGTWLFGAQIACQNTFLAVGQARISVFLALLRKVILLIPLAILLPRLGMGAWGVFTAEPIADLAAAATTSIVFAFSMKRILAHPPIQSPSAPAMKG